MQALKQAAREGDSVRLEAVCEEWSVPAAPFEIAEKPAPAQENEPEEKRVANGSGAEARR